MSKRSSKPIHTRLQPGAESQPGISRFNGFPAARKPLKRFLSCSCVRTGLKPGVNQNTLRQTFSFAVILLTLCFSSAGFAAQTEDAEYESVAEEYIKTYLAAHPLQGTALGLHEYDGKITDYSRLALDAELNRLQRFDDRLSKFDPSKLSSRQSIDLRILQTAVKRDLFEMQEMSIFERNPMVYARAADVNVYIKRNFAPLDDRVRSIVAIEAQVPNILIAARTTLADVLPRPYVELAIQIARGAADFLRKDLDQIRKFVVSHHLVAIPSEVRPRVKETPQYRRATSFASMDTPGPFERRATEAYYYVTPTEKDWPDKQKEEWLTAFNHYTADIISIHEVYPGHYVQFLRLNASPASKVEKIFGSYAFIEGWAHYCEKMMIDEGYSGTPTPSPTPKASATPGTTATPKAKPSPKTSPTSNVDDIKRAAKYRMAQADEAMLRLCRLCVSIKMHTQKMTVDEATKFFEDNCYYEEKPARTEAMRGTFDPGYLNYTLGKLQILKLRDDYKAQQGNEFSLQKFHNELLNHGMPPIRLLREIMLKDKSKWNQVL